MKFIELTVTTTHIGADIISDLFWEFSDLGVVISDLQDVLELSRDPKNWDYADQSIFNLTDAVLVKGYFPVENPETISNFEKRLIALKENDFLDFGTLETSKREIDGELWREQWKEHFKPHRIGKTIIIPAWIEYKASENEIPVYLDSNMAFGTGEHETTSMCVEFLEQFVKPDNVVLDVGCGSGILGIVASKLGAKEVVMTDIDPHAITATEHNMKINNVSNGKVVLKNLLDDTTIVGDVIVCNIMAEILIAFAPYIGGNLTENGVIILSGIILERIDAVIKAYEDAGFSLIECKKQGEWSALAMRKGK